MRSKKDHVLISQSQSSQHHSNTSQRWWAQKKKITADFSESNVNFKFQLPFDSTTGTSPFITFDYHYSTMASFDDIGKSVNESVNQMISQTIAEFAIEGRGPWQVDPKKEISILTRGGEGWKKETRNSR